MRTVTESVETQAQLKALKLAGVDSVQGSLYFETLSANEFVFSLSTKWESFAIYIDARTDDNEAETEIEPASLTPTMQQYANDEVERLDALH